MDFSNLLEKIENSVVFKNFKKQYPDSKLVAGFFVIDFLSNDNKNCLDYKTNGKIFTFNLKENNDIEVVEDKLINNPDKPELQEIDKQIKVEINELPFIAEKQSLEHNISSKHHKIIAVLQKYEQNGELKQIWNLTCMLEGLIILNILINANTEEIIKFERKSMMDLIKKR